MMQISHRTEKFLIGGVSALLFVLVFNTFYEGQPTKRPTAAAEETSGDKSGSEPSSTSEKDEPSVKSEDEDDTEPSEPSEPSQPSEPSKPVSTSAVKAVTTESTESTEKSEVSTGTDEMSQPSVDDVSETDGDKEPSQVSQSTSEREVTPVSDGSFLVKQDGRLFRVIPVEIESQVTVNEAGTVIDQQMSFLNWLKSLFSF